MRIGLLVFAVGLLFSCNKFSKVLSVNFGENQHWFKEMDGFIFYDDEKYTGKVYAVDRITADTLFVKNYKDGMLHGLSKAWFVGGQLKESRVYKEGVKNGVQEAFWKNGKPRFLFTALNDKYEGELKEWDINGNLSHLGHFKNGQEEGLQKMWYITGEIRSNYVIKNGRRYGLLGTKNCTNVSSDIAM